MFFKRIPYYIFGAILAICCYLTFYLTLSYFLTDILRIVLKVNPLVNLFILIVIVFVYSLIDWNKILKISPFSVVFLVVLLGVTLATQRIINNERKKVKILWADPGWGIQGSAITIKGRNFGLVTETGEIFLEEEKQNSIQKWSDEEIVFTQPVPKSFGKKTVYVINNIGEMSNRYTFEIKDPTEVLTPSESKSEKSKDILTPY